MFVKDYMTRHPIMIGPEKKLFEAQQIMTENSVRHLPVVGSGKRLQGLLTRQRLRVSPEHLGSLEVWEITRYLSNLTVDKVMVKGKDLHSIGAEATLEEAADMMIRHKVGGLPVLQENDVVVGVITETDLLIELRELLGATDPGWRVVVRIPSRVGEYAKLTNTISEHGWAIMAMGSVRTPKDAGHWDMVLKVTGAQKEELQAAIDAIDGHKLIDIRETANVSQQREPALPAD
jgi:acetoin utilization protein AcuB